MRIKPFLAALLFVAAPGAALAEGCFWGQSEASMSCAEGTAWDSESRSCVTVASS